MSRHTLEYTRNSSGHVIVGYDRPVKAFFCQVWASDEDDAPMFEDSCFEIDELDSFAVVPKGFKEILVKEACGDIDPNYVKDWRTPCEPTP